MKRIIFSLFAVGALTFVGTQADAADAYGRRTARSNHGSHHDDLEHRDYHRGLEHRDAHRYPMNWRGHERLHDNLEHDGYHDRLEHRSAHRSRAYQPRRSYGYRPYNDIGFYARQFSTYFRF